MAKAGALGTAARGSATRRRSAAAPLAARRQLGRVGLASSAARWLGGSAAKAPLVAHGLQDEHHDSEDCDDDHDEPGQRGPETAVGVGAHDVTVVGNAHHEDEKNRQ